MRKNRILFWAIILFSAGINPLLEHKDIWAQNYLPPRFFETLNPRQRFYFDDKSFNESTNPFRKSAGPSQEVTLIGRWANGPCLTVAAVGRIAYFGNGGYLEIVDFSNPGTPVELGKVLLPGFVRGVAVSGRYAYVVDGSAHLRVIDVSNSANPKEVGFFNVGDRALDVAVSGSYAYVANGWFGLRIIDISNPLNPKQAGLFNTADYAYDVAVSGSYAYVVELNGGLRVIEVSTPSNPKAVGFFDTPGYAQGVAVNGAYAYVADANAGLRIIDVSIPSNPREVGVFGSFAESVALKNSYAYVVGRYDGLQVLDISNRANPKEVGFFSIGADPQSVVARGSYVYIADGVDGLYIFQNKQLIGVDDRDENFIPLAFMLEQNYPNPFSPLGREIFDNPSTTIQYDLPQPVNVTLEIFDLMGRQVRTLVNQAQPAGRYAITWDGRNEQGQALASGLYIYQLRAVPSTSPGQGFVQTRRMALAR